jgi:hypothetical protein
VVESTWESLALPVLQAIYVREERGMLPPGAHEPGSIEHFKEMALDSREAEAEGVTRLRYASEVSNELPLPDWEVRPAIERLHQDDYLYLRRAKSPHRYLNEMRLTGRGLRAIGVWPSENSYDALLHMLESMIESEQDPEEKSKLERLRESLQGIGRDVFVALFTSLVRQTAGLP